MPWPTIWRPVDKQAAKHLWRTHWADQYNPKWDDDKMNQAKLNRMLGALDTVHAKVYDSVTSKAPCTTQEIVTDLSKRGINYSVEKVRRLVMEMCDSGVVREFSPGKFLRVEASAASEPPQIKVVKDLASSPQSAPERSQKVEVKDGDEVISPIGLLNSIAIRVDALSEEAKSISADFVDVVVHIDDYICHVESKVEKMKQLQALLKSIGD